MRPPTRRGMSARLPGRFPWRAAPWPAGVERPLPDRGVGTAYDTGWSRKPPVRVLRAALLDTLGRPLVAAVASPRVVGAEILEGIEPPVIFVANHASHIDTGLVLYCLPTRLRHKTVVAAAADHFFDRRWKAHLWAFTLAAIPIERHRVNRASAELAAGLLDDGWNLIIFPEGGRSPDGWQQPFRGGAAYLAKRTGRLVVPMHLAGTALVLPKKPPGSRSARPSRSPCTVHFGKPLSALPGEDARRLGARIESAVALLADESSSDFWSARLRHAAGNTPSPSGPAASPWRRAWELPRPDGRHGSPDSPRGAPGTPWERRAR